MEVSILLAQKIVAMALMGIIGYVIVRNGLFRVQDSQVLSKLVVYVISPCLIVNSFQIEYSSSKAKGLILAFVISFLIHLLLIAIAWILGKVFRLNNVDKASIIYSNAGNLVVPLVQGILGVEWVFYASAYIMAQSIFIWSQGTSLLCNEKGINLKKIFTNPNVIAVLLGCAMFFTKISLPAIVGDCVSGVAAMIAPASMMVIGMLLADVNLKKLFSQKRPYVVCFFRLIFVPFIVIVLSRITGVLSLHADAENIMMVVLLATMAPVASMVTQISQVYGGDGVYASALNVMSVLLCIVTMPLMLLFYEWI